jgi:hypothetical protein
LRRQKNRRRQGKSPISAVPFLLFDQFSFSLIPALGADEFQPFALQNGDVVSQEMPERAVVSAVESESLTFEQEKGPSEHPRCRPVVRLLPLSLRDKLPLSWWGSLYMVIFAPPVGVAPTSRCCGRGMFLTDPRILW